MSKTILIDLDDTLENLSESWIQRANEVFGKSVSISDVFSWDPSEYFDVSHDEMYALLDDYSLYDTIIPLPGAVETLHKLLDEGHRVYIVTSTPYNVIKPKTEKIILRYFGFVGMEHVIITSNKAIIKGDIMIDDAPHNLKDSECIKLLFSAHHNRCYDAESNGMIRVNCWEDVYHTIKKFL